jgi:hypothetical protein
LPSLICRRKPPLACRIPPSNEYLHRVWRGYRTCARRRLASLVQRKLSCRVRVLAQAKSFMDVPPPQGMDMIRSATTAAFEPCS